MTSPKRINILAQRDINELYELPKFTVEEKHWYFELSNNEQELLVMNASIATKVDAILQLGYFKAKKQFFVFQLYEVKTDVDFLLNKYFDKANIKKTSIARESRRQNQKKILKILDYKLFSKQYHRLSLLTKANELGRLSANPEFIFREILDFLHNNKITLPGYTTLQDIISEALLTEQQRINKILDEQLKSKEKETILDLLQQRDHLYSVTSLKKQPKNFKPKAIYKEIDYYKKYEPLFKIAKRVLPEVKISNNTIIYNANLVEHYTVQSLDRLNERQTCLWLLCFIYQRCQRMLDNLATMFIYTANKYENDVIDKSKELILVDTIDKKEQDDNIAKLLK